MKDIWKVPYYILLLKGTRLSTEHGTPQQQNAGNINNNDSNNDMDNNNIIIIILRFYIELDVKQKIWQFTLNMHDAKAEFGSRLATAKGI